MNKGFTLVELIAVIVILALLVIITTPAYDNISKNTMIRNYESKKNTIESQTLAYVEKYMKNDIYNSKSDKNKEVCFKVKYLIRSGIVASDDEFDEYILNNLTNKQWKDDDVYVVIKYNTEELKLNAITPDNEDNITHNCTSTSTY